jgi:hypothetical protein
VLLQGWCSPRRSQGGPVGTQAPCWVRWHSRPESHEKVPNEVDSQFTTAGQASAPLARLIQLVSVHISSTHGPFGWPLLQKRRETLCTVRCKSSENAKQASRRQSASPDEKHFLRRNDSSWWLSLGWLSPCADSRDRCVGRYISKHGREHGDQGTLMKIRDCSDDSVTMRRASAWAVSNALETKVKLRS